MSAPVPERAASAKSAAPTHASAWVPLDPARARTLSDARLQLHHAIQIGASAGISYLPARPDDSHTNLEWFPALGALVSNAIPAAGGCRVGVAAESLTLMIVGPDGAAHATFPLNGHTISDAAEWTRAALARGGADPKRFTVARHYTIPSHAVDSGARFTAGDTPAIKELAHWFGNGAALLAEIAASTSGSSPVRCWPHHFDIATLIEVGHDAKQPHTIGIGMEPGDQHYDEPYLYVTMSPAPAAGALIMPLAGGGHWHTHDFTAAVLTGSRLVANPADQEQEVRVFLKSARAACRMVVEHP